MLYVFSFGDSLPLNASLPGHRTKNNQNSHTILLVGETGTGKTSLLEIIANVLIGNCYDFEILDRTNEQGSSTGQIQTNSAHIYEFTSKNGIPVSTSIFQCL